MHIYLLMSLSMVQEEDAAKARDRVAIAMGLKPHTRLNFDIETYAHELEELKALNKDLAIELSRQSSGHCSNQSNSGFRGVYARPGRSKNLTPVNRWEAKIR